MVQLVLELLVGERQHALREHQHVLQLDQVAGPLAEALGVVPFALEHLLGGMVNRVVAEADRQLVDLRDRVDELG